LRKVLLCILDGWGNSARREGNAILLQGTPNLDKLAARFPVGQLHTSGLSVGLPEGQMGNSEVGHTNIGAGRIVYQDLVRISLACTSGEILKNPAITAAMDLAKSQGRSFHFLGLVSPGGVHSQCELLRALLLMAKQPGLPRVYVHAFLDGRDTPPRSGLGYIEELQSFLD